MAWVVAAEGLSIVAVVEVVLAHLGAAMLTPILVIVLGEVYEVSVLGMFVETCRDHEAIGL